MERKKITSKELLTLIKEKIQSAKDNEKYRREVEIDGYEITDSFNRLPASVFGRSNSYPSVITLKLTWCAFSNGIALSNVSPKQINFNFENCSFVGKLRIENNKDAGTVGINAKACKLEDDAKGFSRTSFINVKTLKLSKFFAERLEISYSRWLDKASLDLFDVSAYFIQFSGQEELDRISISCHEQLVPVIARFFPVTPFDTIYTWSNYSLGKKN